MPIFSFNLTSRAAPIMQRQGWSPNFLGTNLALWLDASRIGLASGATVTVWPDRSDNAHNAFTPPGGTPPVVQVGAIGSLSTLRFQNTEMFLPNLRQNVPLSAFWVALPRAEQSTNAYPAYFQLDGDALRTDARKPMLNGFRDEPDRYTQWVATTGQTLTGSAAQPLIGRVESDGQDLITALNGVAASRKTLLEEPVTSGHTGSIGAPTSLCDWAELIVVSQSSEGALAQRIEGYLAHKWSLSDQLPAEHPFRHAAP